MSKISNDKLKALVQSLDIIPKEQLESAFKEAENQKIFLGDLLIEKDLISDQQLGQIIADYLKYNFIDLNKIAIDDGILRIVPEIVARKQKVISFAQDKEGIKLAMVNPENLEIINLLEKKTGQEIIPYYTTENILRSALTKYQKGIQKEFSQIIQENISQAKKGARPEDLPIIKIVDTIILYGYENKASDIHIEPKETETLIRFRIDGILHDIIKLSREVHDLVVSRIKILAKLRTDEHASAQDGKIRFKISPESGLGWGEKIDIRVSIIPIVEGEKIVMRLLSERSRQFSLETLGISSQDLTKVKKGFLRPYGMILATGPTGCGKTTTLYAVLKILNRREVNIATIEDPVEYDIEGVNQIQVNPKTNLTFASGLRSILRQDPDIMMVGEIRDEETAGIAINSAMTGHLVLSTLHTNDAPTTLPRLLDMEIEPFLIASTVNLIIAQRLVRKICLQCVVSQKINVEELAQRFSPEIINRFFGDKKTIRIYQGKGCPVCAQTGYFGRIGIFEVLTISEEIRSLIMKRANADQIRQQAIKEGMKTMLEDGISKIVNGITTIEEVLRVSRE